MTKSRAVIAALPLLALLAACDRSDPPSERLERAAEELVSEVENTAAADDVQQGRWAPRNACGDLPGATAFLDSLRGAVDTRDAGALAALAADDVKLDFGGGGGTGELRELLAANDGEYWDMLEGLLELGCAADEASSITIPWYFAQDIPVDPYMGSIVMAEDVPLRNAPASDAPVVARLSWDAVEQVQGGVENAQFVQVRWDDPDSDEPVEGYIRRDQLRSIIDYRLIASRRNDRWRITAIVAGD